MKKCSLLTLFSLIITHFSCIKKGPDDPLLSLRSRKERLVGDWIVESINSTSETYYKSPLQESRSRSYFRYDLKDSVAKFYNFQVDERGRLSNLRLNQSHKTVTKYSFRRDNTYSGSYWIGSARIQNTARPAPELSISSEWHGTWMFNERSSHNASKTMILLSLDSGSSFYPSNNYIRSSDIIYNHPVFGNNGLIKELRNNRIVLQEDFKTDRIFTSASGNVIETYEIKSERILRREF